MINPVMEMCELNMLLHMFEAAVEQNFVMDLDEYINTFGTQPYGYYQHRETEIVPFVYVGEGKATDAFTKNMIVDVISGGDDNSISVYSDVSLFGAPLLIYEDMKTARDEGWFSFQLVFAHDVEDYEAAHSKLSRKVYLNVLTGEYEWCAWGV